MYLSQKMSVGHDKMQANISFKCGHHHTMQHTKSIKNWRTQTVVTLVGGIIMRMEGVTWIGFLHVCLYHF